MLKGCISWPEQFGRDYVAKGYWENIPLGEAFDRIAEIFPNREALVYQDVRVSYGQLKSISNFLATRFLAIGFKPLDRVIVQLPNIPEYVYCCLAFLKIGVIPVMCLPQHRSFEIIHISEKCAATGYLIPDNFRKFNYLDLAEEVGRSVPSVTNILVAGEKCYQGQFLLNDILKEHALRQQPDLSLENFRPDPMEAAVFLLSGGTTGLPKIIPRTHNDYLYNAKITGLHFGFNKDTIYLAIAPLAHNMTLSSPGLIGAFQRGGKVILTTSAEMEKLCQLIEQEKITNLPLVPALVISLLNYEKRQEYDLSSLVAITSGGSKLNPEVASRVKPEIGCELYQQFGMAEGLLTQTDILDPDKIKYNTIGRPVSPGDEIKIVDESGKELKAGETGELLCRGPYTIRGYYDAPDHNEKAFTADGFYRTGDLASMDPENGCFTIEGRKKDLINRGGEKISAEEIENLILSHPDVDNAAVVAMPDFLLGEKACAYVTFKHKDGKITLEDLSRFLLEKNIARFKLPERLEVIQQFPLTNVGKIDKKVLRLDIDQKIDAEK